MPTLRFSLSGDHLTRHAREQVAQGKWRAALSLLVDDLEGMTLEDALAILKGDKRLAGADDSLHLKNEDALTQQDLQSAYRDVLLANRLAWGGKRYRAYARVESLDDADLAAATERLSTQGPRRYVAHFLCEPSRDTVIALERALHYASDPSRDLAFAVAREDGTHCWVLFEEDNADVDLPLWLELPACAQDAVASGFAGLELRGPRSNDAPAVSSSDTEGANKAFDAHIEQLRARIVAATDRDTEYGWHEFRFHDTARGQFITLKAPKRALMAYALSRTRARHLAPDYTVVSESGLKMLNDNPLHTDVWLGCGLPLDDTTYDHESPIYRAFMEMMFQMQESLLGYAFQVLSSGGKHWVRGTLVSADHPGITADDILLVPHAGIEYDLPGRQAGAIICEVGGKLAHLVTVCREDDKPIVRVPDAMKILRPGMHVMLDLQQGKLDISSL